MIMNSAVWSGLRCMGGNYQEIGWGTRGDEFVEFIGFAKFVEFVVAGFGVIYRSARIYGSIRHALHAPQGQGVVSPGLKPRAIETAPLRGLANVRFV
jgi:hypothetical protein